MKLRPHFAVLLMVCAPALAALNMKEGLWETTLTVDGRAQSAGTQCYMRDDIEEMEKLFQGRPSRGQGACRYSGFTASVNPTWTTSVMPSDAVIVYPNPLVTLGS